MPLSHRIKVVPSSLLKSPASVTSLFFWHGSLLTQVGFPCPQNSYLDVGAACTWAILRCLTSFAIEAIWVCNVVYASTGCTHSISASSFRVPIASSTVCFNDTTVPLHHYPPWDQWQPFLDIGQLHPWFYPIVGPFSQQSLNFSHASSRVSNSSCPKFLISFSFLSFLLVGNIIQKLCGHFIPGVDWSCW